MPRIVRCSPPAETANTPLKLNVLVADDDPVGRKVLGRLLEKLGHDVRFAATGLEAVREVADRAYDVLFMDLHMPEMDGIAAARLIVELGRPENRPAIVALTASADPQNREECFKAGMQACLTKPVQKEDVQRFLDERKKASEFR